MSPAPPGGRDGAIVGRSLDLFETLELQRAGCELAGSPLYASVLDAVAADIRAGGTAARILGPHAEAPFGDAIVLRLLAAVHEVVLRGDAPALAAHYPSTGGVPGRRAGMAFLDAVAEHEDEVAAAMVRGVQTNEVGRSAVLLGGFLELARLGLPLRILEVGASAGLNLRVDRYRFTSRATPGFGPADSALVFEDAWAGRSPDLGLPLVVGERRGCDLAPIDPATEAGRLRLRSYVWPDQPARRARLDAALEVAATMPVPVDRADAVSWATAALAEPVPGMCTVLTHSIVFQYLSPDDRRRFLDLVDAAGARATPDAPLAWLRMEPGGEQAETRLTLWPDGPHETIARSPYHGPPVTWLPSRPVVGR